MPKVFEGQLSATGKKFAVIVARFNSFISQKLLEGTVDCLSRHGGQDENIEIIWVPGAFEIPLFAKKLATKKKYDAIICLGTVIRGSTPHFDYVAAEVSKGVAHVSLTEDVPVIFGVLTTDTIEQAIERAGTKSGNKGWDAALAAIECVDLSSQIK
ncbi:MAG: 6,7-dimethyl-8-ribityllumazine synthase [Candidatus Margulisiibacteriota bacterium]|nr:MAG: 6,7-dimethyl-8-ribityllumazine synthase [Bacteroidetes bacterium GWF2_43_11]OGH98119.1 MAG: 6,7-dimethyl-8-ribityllumazine synthase [Candidatus Margulisbacteria bacterium GWD2_39_127]OGI11300.1 MAG: 6,7-dimethyl-8-ribityllumazine synthase [Candidatus Margulisbacteria bacterium GWE2_39_32]PZM78725.1 MAG: 6,7-dimethyl-8-ribityllumazine synthase [Candidatus Margulisiibacteriota bacterium]HAR62134.1 6,7-dimethyl-8-ribityllumazine synthase [Candidatus Margulisiibacteriota bacterium]